MADTPESLDDAWRLSELRSEDGSLHGLVRKRAPLAHDGRDWRAWFTLHYQAARSGLPDSEDMRKLAAFEDRLVAELEHPGFGVLVAVVMVDGRRDHLFYMKDRVLFANKLFELARDAGEYNPSVEYAPDPMWDEFNEMIG